MIIWGKKLASIIMILDQDKDEDKNMASLTGKREKK